MLRSLAVILALLLAGGAQSPPARSANAPKTRMTPPKKPVPKPKPVPEAAVGELREYPIATLKVEGNSHYPEAAIVRLSGLKAGDTANKPVFEAARDRLLATGAFDSVGYRYFTASDGQSYEAVFQIVESGPLYPFRAEDLPFPSAELDRHVAAKDLLHNRQLPATRARIALYSSWIQELAASKGFGGTVLGKVEADGPGQLAIVFRPGGSVPVIADVTFRGNTAVPSSALKPAILGVAIGVPFQEGRFRQLLETSIRPVYESRGRLNVRFPRVTATPSAGVKGLNIEVILEEGDVFQLGEVRLRGAGVSQSQLLRAADFKPGDLANIQAIQEGVERMRNSLRRDGFLMAVVTPERTLVPEAKKVDLLVDVETGDRFQFGRLLIEGLDIHSEPVIRKMWVLKPGDPFNPDYPGLFLQRVEEERIFENLKATNSEVKLDPSQKTAEVRLLFGKAAEKKSILRSP
jgi:outer membrane protein assembly factor BamA